MRGGNRGRKKRAATCIRGWESWRARADDKNCKEKGEKRRITTIWRESACVGDGHTSVNRKRQGGSRQQGGRGEEKGKWHKKGNRFYFVSKKDGGSSRHERKIKGSLVQQKKEGHGVLGKAAERP